LRNKLKLKIFKLKIQIHQTAATYAKKHFQAATKQKNIFNQKHIKKMEETIKTNQIEKKISINKEDEKTTMDDITICLFCNRKNENLESNMIHMIETHKFDVPFIFCLKNPKGFLKLLAKKIFKFVACLTCDYQNFKNYKGLQNHMYDKMHTKINCEDLEEFLYKFYDKEKLLAIAEKEFRRMKEFKILKVKLNSQSHSNTKSSPKKEKMKIDGYEKMDGVESEGWETNSEHSDEAEEVQTNNIRKQLNDEIHDDEEEYGPVTLPNGELLLENGTVIGNKIYQIYYKQRVHFNKFERVATAIRAERRKIKIKNVKELKQNNVLKNRYFTVKDSNKSSFIRVNTLFKARKQVNV